MEIVNLIIIILCSVIMITWALRKKIEIKSMKIEFMFGPEELTEEGTEDMKKKMTYIEDNQDLIKLADYFQEITLNTLRRVQCFVFVLAVLASIFVFFALEEKMVEFGQAIFFFCGAMAQILVGLIIFKNYNFYDPRVIFLAR